MTTRALARLVLALGLATLPLHASDSSSTAVVAAPGALFQLPTQQVWERYDAPQLAYHLMRTYLTEAEWKAEVTKVQRRFKDWERDTKGDMGRFLNDRLIIVALSAAGGEPEKIKRGVSYLALYHEFKEIPPGIVTKFMGTHFGSMSRLLNGFTWEKATDYVKQKRWREDLRKPVPVESNRQETAVVPGESAEIKPAPTPSNMSVAGEAGHQDGRIEYGRGIEKP